MHWFALLIAAAIVLFALDRLALWMEERGWLPYRRRPGRPGGAAPDDAGKAPASAKDRDGD